MKPTEEQKERLFKFLWPYMNRGSHKGRHTEQSIRDFIAKIEFPEQNLRLT